MGDLNVSQTSRRQRLKQRFLNRQHVYSVLVNATCTVCGESDPACLEFDHRNPEDKRASISELAHQGVDFSILAKEIAKCDIICANCHRKKTSLEQGWYQDLNGTSNNGKRAAS